MLISHYPFSSVKCVRLGSMYPERPWPDPVRENRRSRGGLPRNPLVLIASSTHKGGSMGARYIKGNLKAMTYPSPRGRFRTTDVNTTIMGSVTGLRSDMFAQLPDDIIDDIMSRARSKPISVFRFLEACNIGLDEDGFTRSDIINGPFPSIDVGPDCAPCDGEPEGDAILERSYFMNEWPYNGGYVMNSIGLSRAHRKAAIRTCRAVVIDANKLLGAHIEEAGPQYAQSCLDFMAKAGRLDTLVLWWNLQHEEMAPDSVFSPKQMTDIFQAELQPTLRSLEVLLNRAISEGLLMGPGRTNAIRNVVLASTSDAGGLDVLRVLGRCFRGHTLDSLDVALYGTCREVVPNYKEPEPGRASVGHPLSVKEVSLYRNYTTSPLMNMEDRYIVEVPSLLAGVERLRLRQFDTVTASYMISRMPCLRQLKLRIDHRPTGRLSFRRKYAFYSPLVSQLETIEVSGYVSASFVGRVVAQLPRLDAAKSLLTAVGTMDLDSHSYDAAGAMASPTIDSILHIPARLMPRTRRLIVNVDPGRVAAIGASEPFTEFTGILTYDGIAVETAQRLFPNANGRINSGPDAFAALESEEPGYASDLSSSGYEEESESSGVIVIETSSEEEEDPGSDVSDTDESDDVIVIETTEEDASADQTSELTDEEESDPGSEFEDQGFGYVHEDMEYED